MPRRARGTGGEPRKIDAQGRVHVPTDVMTALDVKLGDFISFDVKEGRVMVHKVRWVVDKK